MLRLPKLKQGAAMYLSREIVQRNFIGVPCLCGPAPRLIFQYRTQMHRGRLVLLPRETMDCELAA